MYRLYCEICNYNKITDGSDVKLVEYKRSSVMSEIPKLDSITKKITQKTSIKLPKRFKCPRCGRLITPKKLNQDEDKTQSDYE
jgi:hypothetical protein